MQPAAPGQSDQSDQPEPAAEAQQPVRAAMVVAAHSGHLELRGAADAPGHGAWVDLGAVRAAGMRQLPLARALGVQSARESAELVVVDATAGLLGDAFVLALLGCQVTAIERSPLVAAVARDGLERAAQDPRVDQAALGRLQLVEGDARTLLEQMPAPDMVLMDPMFPPKRKRSALPRKEMQLLRAAVGDDPDAAELLAAARAVATRRVLVKRADDSAGVPGAPEPDLVFKGSTSRVEVYLAATRSR
ncbi:MAG: class I SAM-dependent methyltransferase [Phycisphaerales bacterium]